MKRSFLRPISTIQCKVFLSSQVSFPIGQKCFPRKLKMGHVFPNIISCWHNFYVGGEEEATKCMAEKEDEHIGKLKLFLHREVTIMLKFSCMHNSIYVHVTSVVVTVHATCEGLNMETSFVSLIYQINSVQCCVIIYGHIKR